MKKNIASPCLRLSLFSCMVLCLQVTTLAQERFAVTGYGKASYKENNKGKPMRTWLVAGPFAIDTNTAEKTMAGQERFFNDDMLTKVEISKSKPAAAIVSRGKEIRWSNYITKTDEVDLDAVFNKADYAAGYALAEIVADSAHTVLLGLGSDDAVKVWLNGKQVHANWIARAIVKDNDIVPLPLVKGSNQLLIKVQDMQGGWGFTARLMSPDALADKLIESSGAGKLDDINMLLNGGAAINGKNQSGLTALIAAKIQGRNEVVDLLLKKGAKDEPLPPADALIDGLYSRLNEKPSPAMVLLVAKDGKILYQKAFGMSDIGHKKAATPETKFRIGSVSKQFTATAILKLQEAGKLAVTDKLSKYIPDFPKGDQITIHHLLTHTSGIHSYTNNDDFMSKVTKPIKLADLVDAIKKDLFDFNPGEQWQYNNSGYMLLGYIIEKVTGKSYGAYLQEIVFTPLQMTNTGVYDNASPPANEALGYAATNNKYDTALNWDMTWAGGAGALYSTVGDLYKWNEAVFGGKILSQKSLDSALTPVLLNNGKKPEGVDYGYGWGIAPYRGLKTISHSGGLNGFLSQLERYPDEHLTVAMLTNVTPQQVSLDPNVIAEFYLSDKMKLQSSYMVQDSVKEDVGKYAGRYDFQRGAVMIITADEQNNLFAQLSGQSKFPIYPSAPGEYFWKVVQAKMIFISNEKGEVVSGEFEQGGQHITAPKLKDEVIAKIDTAIYKEYVGIYKLTNDINILVSTEKGRLFAMATGEQRYEISPLSTTVFTLQELNAKIEFVRETNGTIGKLILDMGGKKTDVPRLKQ